MNQEEINKEIFERLERLEVTVFTAKKIKGVKTKRAKSIDLNTPIIGLYNDGFFDDWKTDNDVIKKLRVQVLTPKRASVSNVLRRLANPKKGLLERQGDGTKKNPWKYRKKR